MHIVIGHNHPMGVEDARAFENGKRIRIMTTVEPNPHARSSECHLLFNILMSLSHNIPMMVNYPISSGFSNWKDIMEEIGLLEARCCRATKPTSFLLGGVSSYYLRVMKFSGWLFGYSRPIITPIQRSNDKLYDDTKWICSTHAWWDEGV